LLLSAIERPKRNGGVLALIGNYGCPGLVTAPDTDTPPFHFP
jgi:hypothetical protein